LGGVFSALWFDCAGFGDGFPGVCLVHVIAVQHISRTAAPTAARSFINFPHTTNGPVARTCLLSVTLDLNRKLRSAPPNADGKHRKSSGREPVFVRHWFFGMSTVESRPRAVISSIPSITGRGVFCISCLFEARSPEEWRQTRFRVVRTVPWLGKYLARVQHKEQAGDGGTAASGLDGRRVLIAYSSLTEVRSRADPG
jgi:hypothetical protein